MRCCGIKRECAALNERHWFEGQPGSGEVVQPKAFALIRRFTIFTLSVAFSSTLKAFLSSVFGTIHAHERFLLLL